MIVKNIKSDNLDFKKIMIILIHFVVFGALHAISIMNDRGWLPISGIEEFLHFSLERWLIWVLPCLVLIVSFKKDLYVNLKEMFFNKVKLKTLILCILPFLLYEIFGLMIVKYTGLGASRPLKEFASANEFLSTFLKHSWGVLVGPAIPEEMVFRAWLQNIFTGKSPSKKRALLAIIMSNIMFVIIHLPTYFFVYNYSILQTLGSCLVVFVLGGAFGLMFFKSKNILVPIGAHWLCDVVSFTFFG